LSPKVLSRKVLSTGKLLEQDSITLHVTCMLILIDGYNLLFHSQMVGKGRGPGWLKGSRERLIRFLISGVSQDLIARTTVVFDATQGADPQSDFIVPPGLRIVFAVQHPEADDLLEEMIRSHPTPKRLCVVSSDRRIKRCGRSRKAQVIDSEHFLQRCEGGYYRECSTGSTDTDPAGNKSDKESTLSQNEIDFWIREFEGEGESE
jgi:predicted RNA-binding protein with PIN domain